MGRPRFFEPAGLNVTERGGLGLKPKNTVVETGESAVVEDRSGVERGSKRNIKGKRVYKIIKTNVQASKH